MLSSSQCHYGTLSALGVLLSVSLYFHLHSISDYLLFSVAPSLLEELAECILYLSLPKDISHLVLPE